VDPTHGSTQPVDNSGPYSTKLSRLRRRCDLDFFSTTQNCRRRQSYSLNTSRPTVELALPTRRFCRVADRRCELGISVIRSVVECRSFVRALMGRSVVVIRRYKRCWTVTAAMRAVAECALVRRPSAASQLDISHTIGLHKSFVAPCRRRRHSTCEPSRHVYDDFAPPPDTCPLKITIIASSKQKHAFWQWRIYSQWKVWRSKNPLWAAVMQFFSRFSSGAYEDHMARASSASAQVATA